MSLVTRRLLLAAGCGLLIAPEVARGVRAGAPTGGTLTRGNASEPATLDPHKFNTSYDAAIIGDLFEGLVTYDAAGQPVPGLSLSWAASPDGKRYTFHLRPNLVWSDGTALTAEDAVFSFRRLLDPKIGSVFAPMLYVVKNARAINAGTAAPETLGASAPDPATVVLELDNPAPYLPQILACAYAGLVPRHVIAARGDAWIQPAAMVTSGAYILESWVTQGAVTIIRNPKYHDAAKVALARVVYVPTTDPTSALARFRAGELDLQLGMPSGLVGKLREELPVEARLTPTLLTYYLTLNTTLPKLADPRVRRALSMAIDRDVLTSKVLRGGELPAYSFVPPIVTGYRAATMDFAERSVEARLGEAKRLLAEAGYGPAKPLEIVYSHSANLDLRRIGVIIAGMWNRVGVATTLYNTEGKVHFANLRQGSYEAAFVGWVGDFNDAISFLYVLESASFRSNYSRYNNPAFAGLLGKAAATEIAGARAQLLHDAEAMIMNDQPIIPLYFGVTKNLVSQRVAGWRANAVDVHLSRHLSVIQ